MSVSPAELAATLLRRAAVRREADERARELCLREVARILPDQRRELGFGRAWLIGSVAWGGFGERSDVDLVVEGASAAGAHALAEAIGEATGRSVDVLLFEELPPSFQARVVAGGLHVA